MNKVQKLIKKGEGIQAKINSLKNALAQKEDGNGLKIGTHYHAVYFGSNDQDLIDLINLKIKNFETELKPITDRLEILNELASETLN